MNKPKLRWDTIREDLGTTVTFLIAFPFVILLWLMMWIGYVISRLLGNKEV